MPQQKKQLILGMLVHVYTYIPYHWGMLFWCYYCQYCYVILQMAITIGDGIITGGSGDVTMVFKIRDVTMVLNVHWNRYLVLYCYLRNYVDHHRGY